MRRFAVSTAGITALFGGFYCMLKPYFAVHHGPWPYRILLYSYNQVIIVEPKEYSLRLRTCYLRCAESLARKSLISIYSIVSLVTKRNDLEGFVPDL